MKDEQTFKSAAELTEYIARVTGQSVATTERRQQFPNGVSTDQNPLANRLSLSLNPNEMEKAYGGEKDYRGLAFARSLRLRAAAILQQVSVDTIMAQYEKAIPFAKTLNSAIRRALQEGSSSSAGLVQTMYGEFIELTREKSVIRQSGVNILPMPTGNVSMTRQTSGATAYYTGEGVPVTPTALATKQIRIFSKEIAAETTVSNSLLRHAGPELDVLVLNDLLAAAALRSDLAFIRGSGESYTPEGILNQTAAAGKFNSSGTTASAIGADLENARLKLRAANMDMSNLAWLMSPRSESALRKLRDGNNNFIYKDEMDNGTLNSAKYYVTSQIPENLGGGGNESEVYLFAPSLHFIFDDLDAQVDIYRGGSYEVTAGTTYSGVSRNETVFHLTGAHDFFQKYDRAAAVIQAVTWS